VRHFFFIHFALFSLSNREIGKINEKNELYLLTLFSKRANLSAVRKKEIKASSVGVIVRSRTKATEFSLV
jgi:hypothetical protein